MLQLRPHVPSHSLRSGRVTATERAAGERCGRPGRPAHTVYLSLFSIKEVWQYRALRSTSWGMYP